MNIITNRLLIRQFLLSDFDSFLALIRDKMNSELSVYDEQFPTDEESVRNILLYFSQSPEFMAVELIQEKHVIGFISINPVSDENVRNLGFCVHSRYHNRGYASEAVMAVVDYARTQLAVKKLVSGTAEQNIAAIKLLRHIGFSLVSKEQTSFVNDETGLPIYFSGLSFEFSL